LQTVETVFVRHALPKGEMMHRGVRIDPAQIRRVALMTVEGENDDISGVGQTEAAHKLCVNIPAERKAHWLQPAVGHYGVFNGSRFRSEIVPRISDFVLSNNYAVGRNGAKRVTKTKLALEAGNSSAPAAAAAPELKVAGE
jgi:poly(3-hydroxybutyrate) depolymerase